MLHPADEAFLTHTVRSGWIPEDRARELWDRYAGQPGGLPDALVQSGLLTATQRDQALDALRSGSQRYAAQDSRRIPPTRPDPTPAETDTGSGSQEASKRPSQRWSAAGIPGYTIERELGRGGMGAVYLATQDETGLKVAIKVLLNAGERQVKRFEREINAMARLKHPNVVELVDSGMTKRGPFLVMAFHEGGDLDEALQERRLDRDAVLRLAADAAQALAYAHAQGVLHRDLKPANILIGNDGKVRVTDFGLAKIVDRETRLTRTNAAVGTPHYMAPEQVRGDEYTPAVDSYGLGVVLYQALTGEVPFDSGDRIELYASILKAPPQPPWELVEGVPKDLGQLVLWALEKDPTDRPSCAQLAAGINKHLAGEPMKVVPPSVQRQRRQLTVLGMGAALGVALAATVVAVGSLRSDQPSDAQVAAARADLDAAIAAARRARSGRDLESLLTELEAHAAVEAVLIEVPYAGLRDALERVDRSRERHVEAIGLALPQLLERDRIEEAIGLARQRARIDRSPAANINLARILARQRATAEEAHELAEAAAKEDLDPPARADLARTYLALHRPLRACAVLQHAPPELLGLRARARRLAGDITGAVADVRAAARAESADPSLQVQRIALVADAGGDPREALRALDATRAGSIPEFHLARAAALERLGRYAACKAAFRDALKLDPRASSALGRMHLRRGHALSALVVLEDDKAPRARLDRAVALWLGGGGDATALDQLAGVVHDVRSFAASPSLGAAALRWTARIEVCRDRLEQAEAAALRAWELHADASSAACLAFVRWRRGDAPGARAALTAIPERTAEGTALGARLDLDAGAQGRALDQLQTLPEDDPGRLGVSIPLLSDPDRAARAAQQLYWSIYAGEPGQPAALPVASAEGDAPRTQAARCLLHVARSFSSAEISQTETLLRRALALLPDDLALSLALANVTRDLSLVDAVIAAHPRLPVARRSRLTVRTRLRREAKQNSSAEDLLEDMRALAEMGDLEPAERAAFAHVVRESDPELAWRVLEPALSAEVRSYNAFRVGAELAEARGDAARAKELGEIRDDVRATIRERPDLLRQAFYNEDHSKIPAALIALRRLARDTPLTAKFWLLRAQADFGQGGFDQANISGAEFLLDIRALRADQLSMWIHGLSWNAQIRQNVMQEVTTARIEADPMDPVPWLAHAFFLAGRYNLKKPQDPEDVERAADMALYAVQCRPGIPGPMAFASNLLVSARESRMAAALIHRALRFDPGCEFAVFQLARDAAAEGDVQRALEHLEGISNLEKPKMRRQLNEDPIFDKLRNDEAFVAFLTRVGAR